MVELGIVVQLVVELVVGLGIGVELGIVVQLGIGVYLIGVESEDGEQSVSAHIAAEGGGQ